jgi:IMP dehydrogenase/GMP reductase
VHSEQEQRKQKVFDGLIKKRWGTSINPPSTEGSSDSDNGGTEFKEYEDEDEEARIVPNIEDTVDANG